MLKHKWSVSKAHGGCITIDVVDVDVDVGFPLSDVILLSPKNGFQLSHVLFSLSNIGKI